MHPGLVLPSLQSLLHLHSPFPPRTRQDSAELDTRYLDRDPLPTIIRNQQSLQKQLEEAQPQARLPPAETSGASQGGAREFTMASSKTASGHLLLFSPCIYSLKSFLQQSGFL